MTKNKGAARDWHNDNEQRQNNDLSGSINSVYDAEKKLRGVSIDLKNINKHSAAKKVHEANLLLREAYNELSNE